VTSDPDSAYGGDHPADHSADRYAALRKRAEAIAAAGLTRRLVDLTPDSPVTARLSDGAQVLVFSSNDYLGLAHHPDVLAAWRGAGAGSSRLIAGSRPAHRALEAALEARWGRPALVFSSGYQANLAVMTTLFTAGDVVGSDAMNHASIIDGLRLSRAERRVLPHGDPGPTDLRAVIIEGLYSMDGDVPDFRTYATGGERWLVVDEAHAVGALGPGGRGAAAAAGVRPDVITGTFGKSYGAAGAFVIGPPELKRLLISAGRSFVYTTALAEPAALAAAAGLAAADDERRERLADRTARFRRGLAELGLPTRGDAHVVPVLTGPRTMEKAAKLLDMGIFVPGIRAPTVPPGEERLRFSLSTEHSPAQIDRALEALSRC